MIRRLVSQRSFILLRICRKEILPPPNEKFMFENVHITPRIQCLDQSIKGNALQMKGALDECKYPLHYPAMIRISVNRQMRTCMPGRVGAGRAPRLPD